MTNPVLAAHPPGSREAPGCQRMWKQEESSMSILGTDAAMAGRPDPSSPRPDPHTPPCTCSHHLRLALGSRGDQVVALHGLFPLRKGPLKFGGHSRVKSGVFISVLRHGAKPCTRRPHGRRAYNLEDPGEDLLQVSQVWPPQARALSTRSLALYSLHPDDQLSGQQGEGELPKTQPSWHWGCQQPSASAVTEHPPSSQQVLWCDHTAPVWPRLGVPLAVRVPQRRLGVSLGRFPTAASAQILPGPAAQGSAVGGWGLGDLPHH